MALDLPYDAACTSDPGASRSLEEQLRGAPPEEAARIALRLLTEEAAAPETKALADIAAQRLREALADGGTDPRVLAATQPFRVAYDMRYGGKKEARLVSALFLDVRRTLSEGLLDPEDPRFPAYAAALADCAAQMDRQLYEHWRTLADLLLEAAQAALRAGPAVLGEPLVAHAIAEGARMYAIDPERYLPALEKKEG